MVETKTSSKTTNKSVSSEQTAKKATTRKSASSKKPVRQAQGKDEIQKMRIKISAYEHKILDASVKQIMDTAIRYDGKVKGPVPLPTNTRKYTVNRSSFVNKDAREQFEMRTHKRLLDIINPTPKIIEALTNLELPSGVNIDLKML